MVHPPEESLTLAKRRQMTREHASATQLLVSRERLSPSPRPGPQAAWGSVSLLLKKTKGRLGALKLPGVLNTLYSGLAGGPSVQLR